MHSMWSVWYDGSLWEGSSVSSIYRQWAPSSVMVLIFVLYSNWMKKWIVIFLFVFCVFVQCVLINLLDNSNIVWFLLCSSSVWESFLDSTSGYPVFIVPALNVTIWRRSTVNVIRDRNRHGCRWEGSNHRTIETQNNN